MNRRVSCGVLVSGAGTNLEALLRATEGDDYPARVAVVVSNRPSAAAIDIAHRHGVPACAMPQIAFGGDAGARDHAMIGVLREHGVALVVCAGYDRILSDEVLDG